MASDLAVVNASPLIYLTRAGLLDLLKVASKTIVVPTAVAKEILARGPSDPTAVAIQATEWIRVVDAPPAPEELLAWDLGPGETAVITYAAANPGTIALIDDLAGRRCAEVLGLRLRGTLGIVLIARRSGIVASARETLSRLRAAGMYLSDPVMDRALREVDE